MKRSLPVLCFPWWGCWRQWGLLCATSKTLGMERTCVLTGFFVPLTIKVKLSSLTYTNFFQAALCRSLFLCVVDTAMVLISHLCRNLSVEVICVLWRWRTERTERYCKETCSSCSTSVSDKTENAIEIGELSLGTAMMGRKEAEIQSFSKAGSHLPWQELLVEPSSSGAIIQTTPAPNDKQQIVKLSLMVKCFWNRNQIWQCHPGYFMSASCSDKNVSCWCHWYKTQTQRDY